MIPGVSRISARKIFIAFGTTRPLTGMPAQSFVHFGPAW